MRTQAEITAAHDRIVGTILGEAPTPWPDEQSRRALIAAADVLCWVLEHDHNPNFGKNLVALQEHQEAAGFVLHDKGN